MPAIPRAFLISATWFMQSSCSGHISPPVRTGPDLHARKLHRAGRKHAAAGGISAKVKKLVDRLFALCCLAFIPFRDYGVPAPHQVGVLLAGPDFFAGGSRICSGYSPCYCCCRNFKLLNGDCHRCSQPSRQAARSSQTRVLPVSL